MTALTGESSAHTVPEFKLGNFVCKDVATLSESSAPKPRSNSRSNSVKVFSTIELFTLITDWDWLDEPRSGLGGGWKIGGVNGCVCYVRAHVPRRSHHGRFMLQRAGCPNPIKPATRTADRSGD
jgi:hypothetical protein